MRRSARASNKKSPERGIFVGDVRVVGMFELFGEFADFVRI